MLIRSLTAREVFKRCPEVKKQRWGGEFWTEGYFASTAGKHGEEAIVGRYVRNGVRNTRSHMRTIRLPGSENIPPLGARRSVNLLIATAKMV